MEHRDSRSIHRPAAGVLVCSASVPSGIRRTVTNTRAYTEIDGLDDGRSMFAIVSESFEALNRTLKAPSTSQPSYGSPAVSERICADTHSSTHGSTLTALAPCHVRYLRRLETASAATPWTTSTIRRCRCRSCQHATVTRGTYNSAYGLTTFAIVFQLQCATRRTRTPGLGSPRPGGFSNKRPAQPEYTARAAPPGEHRGKQRPTTPALRARAARIWPGVFSALFFFWGSSFNDGTTQTALDPLGRGPVRTHVFSALAHSPHH
jgi:hypothetical protein